MPPQPAYDVYRTKRLPLRWGVLAALSVIAALAMALVGGGSADVLLEPGMVVVSGFLLAGGVAVVLVLSRVGIAVSASALGRPGLLTSRVGRGFDTEKIIGATVREPFKLHYR